MTKNKFFITAAVSLVLFLLLIVALKTVDVAPIGPMDSTVGLSSLNGFFADKLGTNETWYGITDLLGYVAIAVAALFVLVGACQLVTRKSFKKIDKDIYLLGGFYMLVIVTYVFFEVFTVNFRPVIMEGELEASFPSTHTMFVLCIMSAAINQFEYRLKNVTVRNIVTVLSYLLMAVMVVGRLLSGVHWFTDILGGLLISICYVSLYNALCIKIKE